MSRLKLAWQSLFAPTLYRAYQQGKYATESREKYISGRLEVYGYSLIYLVRTIFKYGFISSPFVSIYFYYRGYDSSYQLSFMLKAIVTLGAVLATSYLVRAVSRVSNPVYVEFLKTYNKPIADRAQYLESLRRYDFAFDAWPVSFSAEPKISTSEQLELILLNPFKSTIHKHFPIYTRIPIKILGYIAAHTITLALMYPGTTQIMYFVIRKHLLNGRLELVEQYNGCRNKIIARDTNVIDTLFIDHRHKSPMGKTLVICSEGNAGYYEIGIMMTPIKAGYSVLGWNHPGFAWSTGSPYPQQEQNAIDAVIQFAIQKLGFDVKDIVMYGWSIGSYVSTWAAVNYPDIKCLVLDAPFDHLMPLAKKVLPASWTSIVKEVICTYADLDVATLLSNYNGPVNIVRRTKDEIICLDPQRLVTNRGNYLLMKLIVQRHSEFQNSTYVNLMLQHMGLTEQERKAIENTTPDDDLKTVLSRMSMYMKDYNGSHCIPLQEEILVDILNSYEPIPHILQNVT